MSRLLWNQLKGQLGPFVENAFSSTTTQTASRVVVDPRTAQPICNVAEATSSHVDAAIASAKKAESAWSSQSGLRRDALFNLAKALERHQDDMAEIEMLQTGKSRSDASYEVSDTVECFKFFAGYADKLFGQSLSNTVTVREPYGTVGLVTSFNYPLMLAGWKLAPALAAGNCVLLKPAPQTPLTSLALAYLAAPYLPPGVLSVLPGGTETGQRVIDMVDKASFTGSTRAGQAIMRRQSDRLLPLVLECGGKNPAIVLKDADLDATVEHVALGAFSNAGQNCCAISRVLVHEKIHDEFIQKLQGYVQQKIQDFEPLIDEAQFSRVQSFLTDKQQKPAFTAPNPYTRGYYIPPTVFTNVKDSHRLATEEIFGPVLSVLEPFSTVDEAIHRTNASQYGLAAGVFSRDYKQARRVAQALHTGYVWINMYNIMPPYSPFGGRKLSGVGNDLGQAAVEEFTFVKTIMADL